MVRLVGGHSRQDRTTLGVIRRQAPQMIVEVRFDLSLRFADETEAGSIADDARRYADASAARVPEWIENAVSPAELGEPFRAPREMIALFGGGFEQVATRRRRSRAQRLAEIESLSGNLAGAIDTHESRARVPIFGGQCTFPHIDGRGRPARCRFAGDGMQTLVRNRD
jgi:hypothetical protein